MLKIARIDGRETQCLLRLEGRLVGPWVDELERACVEALAKASSVGLDLADVSFIDRAGVALLQRLGERGVALRNCSGFVSVLLSGSVR
jgi:ABC-type transporter Mla MlaB component